MGALKTIKKAEPPAEPPPHIDSMTRAVLKAAARTWEAHSLQPLVGEVITVPEGSAYRLGPLSARFPAGMSSIQEGVAELVDRGADTVLMVLPMQGETEDSLRVAVTVWDGGRSAMGRISIHEGHLDDKPLLKVDAAPDESRWFCAERLLH